MRCGLGRYITDMHKNAQTAQASILDSFMGGARTFFVLSTRALTTSTFAAIAFEASVCVWPCQNNRHVNVKASGHWPTLQRTVRCAEWREYLALQGLDLARQLLRDALDVTLRPAKHPS